MDKVGQRLLILGEERLQLAEEVVPGRLVGLEQVVARV
jgi:hypothetical protein